MSSESLLRSVSQDRELHELIARFLLQLARCPLTKSRLNSWRQLYEDHGDAFVVPYMNVPLTPTENSKSGERENGYVDHFGPVDPSS